MRIVNTFAPGGAADYLARIVADHLSTAFKQQFFVETRAGAAGVIGVNRWRRRPTATTSSSPPSPCWCSRRSSIRRSATIRSATSPIRLYRRLADPVVGEREERLKSLEDFVASGKESGKPLTYSSSGVGSERAAGGAILWPARPASSSSTFPTKARRKACIDLVAGHIALSAQTVTSAAGQMRGGTVTGLAVSAEQRLPDYPDMPTFKELGYPTSWRPTGSRCRRPTGLPDDIVRKVNREINMIMTTPEMRERMREDGMLVEA